MDNFLIYIIGITCSKLYILMERLPIFSLSELCYFHLLIFINVENGYLFVLAKMCYIVWFLKQSSLTKVDESQSCSLL